MKKKHGCYYNTSSLAIDVRGIEFIFLDPLHEKGD